MKEKRTALITNTLAAVGNAAVIFCIIGIIYDQIYKGNFLLEHYSFTKMVIGTMIIGLGFGLPTFVYENEKMSLATQTLIHMGIGCIIMTITAFIVGWIPTEKGVGTAIGALIAEVAIAFVIWMFFYAHQKKLADEMNKKIEEMNQ